MNKEKLLIFTDWFAPGYKAGGPIRSVVNLVENLEDMFTIYIFTSDRDLNDKHAFSDIASDTWVPFGVNSRVFYASPFFLKIKNISRIIEEVRPDTIYLNSMWSVYFTFCPLWINRNNSRVRMVLAPRGMLKPAALAVKPLKKKWFLQLLKKIVIKNDLIFHVTEADESLSVKQHFTNNVRLIGNFAGKLKEFSTIKKKQGQLHLISISRIHPIKNTLFLVELLINHEFEGSIFLSVYGPTEDINYALKCSQKTALASENIKIRFYDEVKHDEIHDLIQKSHFFILPTLGENFGHAIYESFAAGRPVIISDKTPWRDLESKSAGFDISLEDTKAWVETIQKCADMDQSEFDTWCFHAYNLAKNYSDNNQLKEKYIQLFS